MAKQFNGPVTFVAGVTMNGDLTTLGTGTHSGANTFSDTSKFTGGEPAITSVFPGLAISGSGDLVVQHSGTFGSTVQISGSVYARGGVIPPQPNAGALVDDTAVLTAAQISARVLTFDGSAPRSKATDTAANIVAGLGLTANNDSADFYIINTEASNPNFKLTITAGSGVTLVGNMVVQANAGDTHQTHGAQLSGSASGGFRLQRRGASAVPLYRIS